MSLICRFLCVPGRRSSPPARTFSGRTSCVWSRTRWRRWAASTRSCWRTSCRLTSPSTSSPTTGRPRYESCFLLSPHPHKQFNLMLWKMFGFIDGAPAMDDDDSLILYKAGCFTALSGSVP
ncbi:hypothetical protein AVEN_220880-1 [Araneus ventricosus]|uniref:Uncharacterized protein n=1 Tax=Araneus ventricosus TaxID=182803 RepID=A0A4Y2W8Q9_ARAVE|nr:hypothetical protein AVEN_220880-1 [Araneus ventricosus]